MSVLFHNNATTTLSAGVGNSSTSITVADGSVFPSISGSDYFYVTLEVDSDSDLKEIVKCTARNGNTLTITRGQDGTSARTFSSGDKCELRLNAAALNDAVVGNNTTEMLLNQFTGDGSTTAFTLSNSPDENLTNVFLSGVYQSKSNYSISGSSLTFSTAPPNGLPIEVMVAKSVEISIATPADDSVTTAKIANDAVTSDKLSNALSTKIAGIETSADVTDTANVVAALSAGTGVSISAGGEIANTSPDQTVALTGAGSASVSGTYPNFTISSTDTDTTYSVGDGGLTEVNFTSADNTKLDAINQGVATTDSPTFSNMTLNGTDAILVPVGTTAQRPTGAAGQLRYNSTTAELEGYTTEWGSIGGSAATTAPTLTASDNVITVTNASSYNQPVFLVKSGNNVVDQTYDNATGTITLGNEVLGNIVTNVSLTVKAQDFGLAGSDESTVSVTYAPAFKYYRFKNFTWGSSSAPMIYKLVLFSGLNGTGTTVAGNGVVNPMYYTASFAHSSYPFVHATSSTYSGWWLLGHNQAQTTTSDYFTYSSSSPVTVRSVLVSTNGRYRLATVDLQGSNDNATWTELKTIATPTGTSGAQTTTVNL